MRYGIQGEQQFFTSMKNGPLVRIIAKSPL
jgi:hypothetical protein